MKKMILQFVISNYDLGRREVLFLAEREKGADSPFNEKEINIINEGQSPSFRNGFHE